MASQIVHHHIEPREGRERRSLSERILVRFPALGRANSRAFYTPIRTILDTMALQLPRGAFAIPPP